MCGIAGLVTPPGTVPSPGCLQAMSATLKARGPDGHGLWQGENLALAHRRLAVIDLSREGQQPMVTADERFVLTFNGEIYNFQALRRLLDPHHWRGHSDSEVLLEALARWGVARTLPQLVGMFAFAFLDRQRGKLWLVRDRLGIKPLYYGWEGGRLLFGSELRSLEAGFQARPAINAGALALMMRHNHVPAPHSIYEGVYKLSPGSVLAIELANPLDRSVVARRFWSPEAALSRPLQRRSDEEWQTLLHDQLREAVRARLVSDVPLGAFLSGGIDSTLVVALMQEQADAPVKTFTIGFSDQRLNEAEHARATAEHLGTDHEALYLTEQHVLDAVEALPGLCDEPFADQSILPTFLLCQLARRNVTVALSGDGGDELQWGYARYPAAERMEQLRARLPRVLRPLAAAVLRQRLLAKTLSRLPLPRSLGRASRLADKLSMAAQLLSLPDENLRYRFLLSYWKDPTALLPGASEPSSLYRDLPPWVQSLPRWKRRCVLDLLAYLPDDCLTKLDRASMAVGLEARVPLLDHRIVELAYQLPERLVRERGRGKVLLRRILDHYVPRTMMDRPKAGFVVPLGDWLRGPLRDWSHDLLSSRALGQSGLFQPQPIRQRLLEHDEGTADWSAYLWGVLMFQHWNDQRR